MDWPNESPLAKSESILSSSEYLEVKFRTSSASATSPIKMAESLARRLLSSTLTIQFASLRTGSIISRTDRPRPVPILTAGGRTEGASAASKCARATSQNVGSHISNAYSEGELEAGATTKESFVVRLEGNRSVRRRVQYYNLDMITSCAATPSMRSAFWP
jgi:hypothetical protein